MTSRMFSHFMKKEKTEEEKEDKERRKKEKRERKRLQREQQLALQESQQAGGGALTKDDLSRLDEVRRSLKAAAANAEQQQPAPHRPLSRPTALPPAPPPRAPSRGILKAKNSGGSSSSAASSSQPVDVDDAVLLLKNTQANEAILYENVRRYEETISSETTTTRIVKEQRRASASSSSGSPSKRSGGSSTLSPGESQDREVAYEVASSAVRVRPRGDHVSPVLSERRPLNAAPALSQSEVAALVDGEGLGAGHRRLNAAGSVGVKGKANDLAPAREVLIRRQGEGGSSAFGLILRRTAASKAGTGRADEVFLLERDSAGEVFFDGEGSFLLPSGDELLEVEGNSVSGKSRDDLEAIFRSVTEKVFVRVRIGVREMTSYKRHTVKVRALPELHDLAHRALNNGGIGDGDRSTVVDGKGRFKLHKVGDHKGVITLA